MRLTEDQYETAITLLRSRIDELQGACNEELARRRDANERAAFLAGLSPDLWCAVRDVVEQVLRVKAKYGRNYASAHEGYGLMCEEVAELFDEVRKPESHARFIRGEAKDVAVVALRMMTETA